jgi:hypothetical protein
VLGLTEPSVDALQVKPTDEIAHSTQSQLHKTSLFLSFALAPEKISDYVANLQEPHARAWLASVLKDLPTNESTRVVVTLWALWSARRKIIHEGKY